jgi:hypothetical protein
VTRVIHIRDVPPGWQRSDDPAGDIVYIGRPGRFGNPYPLRPGEPRGSTIERYRHWLHRRLLRDPDFAAEVAALHGKTLVCYCAPKACHGDTLAKAAEWLQSRPDLRSK